MIVVWFKKQLFISIMFWSLISIYLSLLVSILQCPPQIFPKQFNHLVSMRTVSVHLYSLKAAIQWAVISDGIIRSIIHITFIWGLLMFHHILTSEMWIFKNLYNDFSIENKNIKKAWGYFLHALLHITASHTPQLTLALWLFCKSIPSSFLFSSRALLEHSIPKN